MTRPGKNHSIDSFYSKMHLLLQKSLKDLGQGAGHAIASIPSSAFREKWGSGLSLSSAVTTAFPGALCSHSCMSESQSSGLQMFFPLLKSLNGQKSVISIGTFLGICSGPCLLLLVVSVSSLVWGKRV